VVSPDPLSPTPSVFFSYEVSENTEEDSDDREPAGEGYIQSDISSS
jgi:hypothetical protein